MRHTIWISLVLALLLTGCPKGKYDDLVDAPESDRVAAQQLWADYMKALGNRNASKDPILVAGFFSQPLMAGTTEAEFKKQVTKCLGKRSAGAFNGVDVEALKNGPDSLLLVVDSKAGQAAIPVVKDGDRIVFSEMDASTGNWTGEAKPGPSQMPEEPIEVLYAEMGDSAMVIHVRWWIESYVDTRRMLDRVHRTLQKALDAAGIEMPYPTQNVNVRTDSSGRRAD